MTPDHAPFQYRYTTGGGDPWAWVDDPLSWTVLYTPRRLVHHPMPPAVSEAWSLCWPDAEGCA
jgi:hypothetical protein